MKKIRVGIIGVGNCASSLVQGVYYYRDAKEDDLIPGIMHVNLGGYHISDIEFTFGVDIDKNKVGKDLAEAIYEKPNNTYVFAQVPKLNVPVVKGRRLDSIGKYLASVIEESDEPEADLVKLIKETETDMIINYLPVGSEEATRYYAEIALKAGVGFINAIPVFIASNKEWAERFKKAGLPIIGDDIKSQVGATILHRTLVNLFNHRGVKLERTSQLNVGGNTDFLNMLERERLKSKKISKTGAVISQLPYDIGEENVYIGPSDYIAWLKDRKWAHIRLEGRTFGDVPLNIELKLEVWDSPNSAGVIIDAIRCLKLAKDKGLSGPLIEPSAYFMKTPPVQIPDHIAKDKLENWIKENSIN